MGIKQLDLSRKALKILLTYNYPGNVRDLHENDVAPRFDLATEALIVTGIEKTDSGDKRIMVLPRPSADQLCHLIITEDVQTVIHLFLGVTSRPSN